MNTRLKLVLIFLFAFTWPFIVEVQANPVVDNVAAGNVTINQTPNSTVVNQASQKAVINWQSFNINPNESTHFQQPQGGVALNRISAAGGASQIYGRLSATGQIILVNPAGIYFSASAVVNVGGLIASTADIRNQDFLNGIYAFSIASPYTNASIINKGTIVAAQHGLIALIGSNVQNDGTIEANFGQVVLASGNAVTMSFSGDDLVSFAITKGSDVNGKVTNTGRITANGGKVLVTAENAQNVLDNIINLDGIVEAKSVGTSKGTIIISGSRNSGVVRVNAKMNVSGKSANEKGGDIQITGKYVLLDSDSALDVSGYNGGGNINVGNTDTTGIYFAANSIINADAINNGNGGNVKLWAQDSTKAYGTITARGGALQGNGGFIETSGYHYLSIAGIKINLSAPHGTYGTWLLDPYNVSIQNSGTPVITPTGSDPRTFSPDQDDSIVLVADLEANLANANVVINTGTVGVGAQAGDIYVNDPVTWANSNSLTLSAFRNIVLNADITNTNNTSTANVNLIADNTGTGIGTVCGAGSVVCGGTPGGIVSLAGTGTVNVYYNPTVFGTPDTIYTGGTAPVAYMLINQLGAEGDTTTSSLASLSNVSGFWGLNFALAKNIDASATASWNSGAGFIPIALGSEFTGQFDGQGYAINGLTINSNTYDRVGLFGTITNTTVKNISLTNASIIAANNNMSMGTLAGAVNGSTISNATVSGTISTSGNVNNLKIGGLIGVADSNSTIQNSASTVDVTIDLGTINDYSAIGGLVGYNDGAITNSTYNGTIEFSNTVNNAYLFDIGGLVGYNSGLIDSSGVAGMTSSGSLTVSSSLTSDDITRPQENFGGIVGRNNNPGATTSLLNLMSDFNITIIGNASTGDIIGGARYIGGIVADNAGSITNTNYAGTILVTNNINTYYDSVGDQFFYAEELIGGIVGLNRNNSVNNIITNSVTSGNITYNQNPSASTGIQGKYGRSANAAIGGLIGINYGSIDNSGVVGTTSSGIITVNTNLNNNGYLQIGGIVGNQVDNGSINSINSTISSRPISFTGNVNGSNLDIGGITGRNETVISNVSSSGTITYSGNLNTILQDVYDDNTHTITNNVPQNASFDLGGITGENVGSATLTNATNSSTINITSTSTGINGSNTSNNFNIGGIVGYSNATIENVVNSGNISVIADIINSSNLTVGGLLGAGDNTFDSSHHVIFDILNDSHNTGNITYSTLTSLGVQSGSNINVGGAGGTFRGKVDSVYSTGQVSVTTDVSNQSNVSLGALFGSVYTQFDDVNLVFEPTTLNNVYSTGDVIFNSAATGIYNQSGGRFGGLIGDFQGELTNSNSNNNITITSDVSDGSNISIGGIAGNSYSSTYDLDPPNHDFIFGRTKMTDVFSTSTITYKMNSVGIYDRSNLTIGGIVASGNLDMTRANYNGDITSSTDVGGPINNYASMNIGGVIGSNNINGDAPNDDIGNLIDVTATGAINLLQDANGVGISDFGNITVGGLIGGNSGLLNNSGIVGDSSTIAINIITDMTGGSLQAGGLVGAIYSQNIGGTPTAIAHVSNASTSSSVTVSPYSVGAVGTTGINVTLGGAIGSSQALVTNVSSSGKVWYKMDLKTNSNSELVNLSAGGLVGSIDQISVVTNSTTSSDVVLSGPGSTVNNLTPLTLLNGLMGVGGFAGSTGGTIDNSGITGNSNTGTVTIVANSDKTNATPIPTIIFAGGFAGNFGGTTQSTTSGSAINAIINTTNSLTFIGGFTAINNLGSSLSDASTNARISVSGSSNGGAVAVGGLVGANLGSISESFATGTINVNMNVINNGALAVGGLVGMSVTQPGVPAPPTISDAYSSVALSVTGNNNGGLIYVGGVIGANGANLGPLGGLTSGGAVTNVYNSGAVKTSITTTSGITRIGGVLGNNEGADSILTNSFWDTEESGQSQMVGGGGAPVVGGAGGCYNATSCTNGGVADLTAQATYETGSPYISGTGWDFTNTWGILENLSYPFLQALNPGGPPRVITGTAPTGNVGGVVNLVQNGQIIGTASVNSNNKFLFMINNDFIADGTPLLIYLAGGTKNGNYIFSAPAADGSISGLALSTDVLKVGDTQTSNFSNTDLSVLLGNLADNNIFYTASGADITLGNSSLTNLQWITSATTSYLIDGFLANYSSTATNLNFQADVDIATNKTVTTNGAQVYLGSVDAAGNAGFTGASINYNGLFTSVNDAQFNATNLVFSNGLSIGGDGTFNAINMLVNGQATIGGDVTLNATNSTFNNNVNISGSANVTGNTTINGGLSVGVNGTFGGASLVTVGAATINGDAQFNSTTTRFNNNLNIGGTATVTSNSSTFNGLSIGVNGIFSGNTMVANGATTITGNAQFNVNSVTFNNTLSVSGLTNFTANSAIFNAGSSFGNDATFNFGSGTFNGAVNFANNAIFNGGNAAMLGGVNGNSITNIVANNTSSFALQGTLSNINSVTVNGSGSFTLNTNDQQEWHITQNNGGYLNPIAGVTNQITFNNTSNLTGGTNNDVFIFDDGVTLAGSVNGGDGNNTLNLTAIIDPFTAQLTSPYAGNITNNLNNQHLTGFSNIQNLLANNISTLNLPKKKVTLNITGPTIGSVSKYLNFSGFNTFVGSNSTRLNLELAQGTYTINYPEQIIIVDNIPLYFIGIPFFQLLDINLGQVVTATYFSAGNTAGPAISQSGFGSLEDYLISFVNAEMSGERDCVSVMGGEIVFSNCAQ